MKRIALYTFATLLTLVSWTNYANNTQAHPMNYTYEYDFTPHASQEFQSPFPWEVKVSCTMTTQDDEDLVQGKLISSKVTLNGKKYKQGEQLTLPIHNGDKFKITAGKFIKGRVENMGENSIHIKCKL